MEAHKRPGVRTVDCGPLKPCKLVVSWSAYRNLIEELALLIADSRPKPGVDGGKIVIVGITTGGALPARCVCDVLKAQLALVGAKSYVGTERQNEGYFSSNLLMPPAELQETNPVDVVIVDDTTDTGRTFGRISQWVRYESELAPRIHSFRTASLWHKGTSSFEPDMFVDRVMPMKGEIPWVMQPHEWLEGETLEGLRARTYTRLEGQRKRTYG
ncbi:MAG: phosphoribosyltransferase family protein [Patescibacteria group bacterium]